MRETVVFLYIEDDPNDVELVKMALHRQHAGTLRVVNDGHQAIEYLTGEREFADRERFPIPDVILLDIKMPRMDGFGFLTWLRNDSPNHLKRLPVVIMSSSDEQSDVNRAYDLGVNCYMTKPVDWQMFRERMKLLGMFWAEHAETPTP